MAFFGEAMIVCVAIALVALGAGRRRFLGALGFVSFAPILLGPVVLSRFDLWPAALVAAAMAALVSGRLRLGHVALGAAVAAKLYPVVLAPDCGRIRLAARGQARGARLCGRAGRGRRRRLRAVSRPGAGRNLAQPLGPGFAPASDREPRRGPAPRRASPVRDLAHDGDEPRLAEPRRLGARRCSRQRSRCSRRVALVAVWVLFARGPARRDRLVLASGAALVAFIVGGKVLSPQFLIWLIPVIPLVRGRRGLAATALLATALVLTQLWFPYRYWELALHFGALESWLVLARDLVLVALLLVLAAAATAPRRGRPRSSSRGLSRRIRRARPRGGRRPRPSRTGPASRCACAGSRARP